MTEYSASVTVANVAPTATFQAPSSVITARAFSLALVSPVDAPGDMPSLQYAFDCGDGAGYSSLSPSGGGSCAANAAGMRSVKGKVRDKNGAVTEYSATLTIADALSLTIVSPGEGESFVIDTPVVLAATFTEQIQNTSHTCAIGWGDETDVEEGKVTEASAGGTCDAEHLYATPGQYTIKMAVNNTYGDSSTATVTVVVDSRSK